MGMTWPNCSARRACNFLTRILTFRISNVASIADQIAVQVAAQLRAREVPEDVIARVLPIVQQPYQRHTTLAEDLAITAAVFAGPAALAAVGARTAGQVPPGHPARVAAQEDRIALLGDPNVRRVRGSNRYGRRPALGG